ncbi:hypothetical protein HOU66_gp22 [Pectobacterium phage Arno160]|uniref:Uncharacterized protein n=1 Tax=Pectobacterium phage Arno160 TaxID=2488835 RepID=A0A3G8F1W0_9CAUD|nr:hypothetical protein HOU66_gp22 [Pectobacterium phage Arno160]AZF88084.1 hypothetical protein Arno160_gp22 [Pectobacterium phage Arno160]
MSTVQDRLAARAAAAVERSGSQQDVEKGGEGITFKLAPKGKQKARLVGYIETGVQPNTFDTSKEDRKEFRLRFALFGNDCQEEDGRPITIDTFDMPISRFERAAAVKLFLKMCPKRDADHFIGLLDRVFWLEIDHKEGKADSAGKKKTFANIKKDGISVALKDLLDDNDNVIGQAPVACPPAPDNIFQIFEWDMPSKEDFDALKPWDKSKLRASKTFAGSVLQQLVGDGEKKANTNDGAATGAPPDEQEGEEKKVTAQVPDEVKVSEDDLPPL